MSEAPKPSQDRIPRGVIAEWTVTIILLLFGTTTLVQAFVIPTGSMEDTLLIGDHLLVDKLAYAPAGPHYQIPAAVRRRQARRHHRVPLSGRHPADVREARDGRSRRPHPPGEQGGLLNGHKLNEPYKYNKTDYIRFVSRQFSRRSERAHLRTAQEMLDRTTSRTAKWSCRRVTISPWATIAIRRSTAATGVLCRARTSSASR